MYEIKKFLSKNIFFIFLIFITVIIVGYKLTVQIELGPVWDTYDFLLNALEFAGMGIGYSDMLRPPLLPFLTSIIFRFGFISANVIFLIDAILFIFGTVGLYLLLKLRFSSLGSFLGCFIYLTMPIVLTFIASGLSDLPSISFSIWTIYFIVLGIKRNPKFFYLAFPFFLFAFLTRYSSALIIFPIILFLYMNRDLIKNKTHLMVGIILCFIILTPVLIFFSLKYMNPFYPFFSFFSSTTGPSLTSSIFYNPDLLFFIKLPEMVGREVIVIIIAIIWGFLIYETLKIKRLKHNLSHRLTIIKKINFIILMVLILVFVITFGKIFYMFSEIIFFLICILIYELFSPRFKNLDFNLLFIAWFMSYFIFHSIYAIKDARYFLTMAPALSYFLILGLNFLSKSFKLKIKGINLTFPIFSILISCMLIFSVTTSYFPSIVQENSGVKYLNQDFIDASNWLKSYDPNYKEKIIYSDFWPYSSWYLKMDIKKMPIFKGEDKFYSGIKDYNITRLDIKKYDQELKNSNATYYFGVRKKLNLTSFEPIKEFGVVVLYKKMT